MPSLHLPKSVPKTHGERHPLSDVRNTFHVYVNELLELIA